MLQKRDLLVILAILLFAAGVFFRENGPLFAAFSIILMLQADYFVLGKKTGEIIRDFSWGLTGSALNGTLS